MYVFLPSKFELPSTAAADRMTIAVKEFTSAIKNRKGPIPLTDNSINKAIEALRSLSSPTRRPTATEIPVSRPRVSPNCNQQRQQEDDNSTTTDRVLRPRVQKKKQLYPRGTRVYKMFKDKYHQGYICDFDDKEGYYKARYEDGDIEEYDEDQMKNILHRPNNWNIRAAMAKTRFERV